MNTYSREIDLLGRPRFLAPCNRDVAWHGIDNQHLGAAAVQLYDLTDLELGRCRMAVKAGDVVELKSGGPPITVQRLYGSADSRMAHCTWFNGMEAKSGDFSVEALKPYEDPAKRFEKAGI